MTSVDESLATGRYTDRRGRAWNYDPDFDVWVEYSSRDDGILHLGWIVDTKDVRLLIERDEHRATCPGLGWCIVHPVPRVVFGGIDSPWTVIGSGGLDYTEHDLFDEAIDAARALAAGE